MTIDRTFRETFNSGATRILNAAGITKTMIEKTAQDGGEPQFLFGNRGLNRVVFIKKPKDRGDVSDFYEEGARAKKQNPAESPRSQIVTMVYQPVDEVGSGRWLTGLIHCRRGLWEIGDGDGSAG